jgi:uncharacterized membrane protein
MEPVMDFPVMDLVYALLRWLHLFVGVVWIGMLYYFNFVQGGFLAKAEAPTKLAVQAKLLPEAMWWFRWGAAFTWIIGVLLLTLLAHKAGLAFFETKRGLVITLASFIATLMAFNVWFVIWPAQKIVIGSAQAVAAGGQADPNAAARGTRALTASRHNVFFSIPMFLLMITSAMLPLPGPAVIASKNLMLAYAIPAALYCAFEVNALVGKTGPLTTVRGVITSGFVMAPVLYGALYGALLV